MVFTHSPKSFDYNRDDRYTSAVPDFLHFYVPLSIIIISSIIIIIIIIIISTFERPIKSGVSITSLRCV